MRASFRSRSVLPLLLLALAGCRGENSNEPPHQFLPDMDDQFKVKAQSQSHFFKEFYDEHDNKWYGRSMRDPVVGTVAFGAKSFVTSFEGKDFNGRDYSTHNFTHRERYLRDDPAFYDGKNADGSYVDRMPLEMSEDLIALGHEKFEIFCMVCHGGMGDGQGVVGQRWSYPLPSWHQEQYYHGGEKGQDGYIFHTIRHGVPNVGGAWELKMPSYGRKMTEQESWAIVAYLRVLQQSQRGKLEDLSEPQRQQIEREKPAPSAQPTGGAAQPATPAAQPATGKGAGA